MLALVLLIKDEVTYQSSQNLFQRLIGTQQLDCLPIPLGWLRGCLPTDRRCCPHSTSHLPKGETKGVKASPIWAGSFVNSFIPKRGEYMTTDWRTVPAMSSFQFNRFTQELKDFSFSQFLFIPPYVERCYEEQF